jgi:sugar phosphate isomerase/epimerase
MKLGVSVATYASQFGPIVFRDGSLRDSLATIKTLGYDGVDLFADCKTDEQIDEIRALFAEHQLEVAMYIAIFLSEQGVNLSDRSDAARQASLDAYKTQIEKAHRLGAQRVPVGYLRGQRAADDPPEAYCERLAASLATLCDFAAGFGVTICLEPINRYEINTFNNVEQALAFIDQYQLVELGLLLDLFHMNIEDVSLEASIAAAADRIQHFHVPDSNRYAAGSGHLDYVSILKALDEANYAGYLMLEAFPHPDTLTCAQSNIGYLRQVLAAVSNQDS